MPVMIIVMRRANESSERVKLTWNAFKEIQSYKMTVKGPMLVSRYEINKVRKQLEERKIVEHAMKDVIFLLMNDEEKTMTRKPIRGRNKPKQRKKCILNLFYSLSRLY